MSKHQRSVSMRDVAARSGVSATTVPHVLNQVPGKRVRPETRVRVRSAAEELRYVLKGAARSLRTRRSHVIAMVGDEIAVARHAFGIVQGARESASKRALA
jgi:LacI family transcriptional regulator